MFASCAASAALHCRPWVASIGREDYTTATNQKSLGAERFPDVGRSHMVHFVDKHLLQRANTALLLTLVWGGVAGCAIAAMVYDVSNWIR
jgi:hypothetical protein